MTADKAINLSYQPTRTTLSDLLSRWVQLEPERCCYDHTTYHVNIHEYWHALCGGDNALGVVQEGLLQMALQDALAERDFSWTLSVCSGSCSATVRAVIHSGVADRAWVEITTYSEVMALLRVYLEALFPSGCGLDA